MSPTEVVIILSIGLAISIVILALAVFVITPLIVVRQYQSSVPRDRFKPIDGSEGAGSSDLRYFILAYDCRNEDVVIEGQAPSALHWQFGAFDGAMRVLDGGYLNHKTTTTNGGKFNITLSARLPEAHDFEYQNRLDCSSAKRGLLIYRVLCPSETVVTPHIKRVLLSN